MKHDEFTIGSEFHCGGNRWRCTDLGRRVVVAIPIDQSSDPSWLNGPPYALGETVFDEYDIEGCALVSSAVNAKPNKSLKAVASSGTA